jgi:hypothetical protein
LEQILDYEVKVRTFDNITLDNPVEEINEDSGLGDGILIEDGFADEEEVVEEEIKKEKIDPKLMQEYVEYKKPSELSISEQRSYARTGKLPEKKK